VASGVRQTVLANSALNWQISLYILGKFHQHSLRQNFGEIEHRFFRQTLCAAPATFCCAIKFLSLVKLIPDLVGFGFGFCYS